MADWQYSRSARRFRDADSGRFISATKIIDLRDGFPDRRRGDVDALVRRLADQQITVQEFEREMTQSIRELQTAMYSFGRGGLNAMTDADYLAADALVEEQRQFLRAFVQDIADGKLSEAQIGARAKLYYGSSMQAYERGRAAAFNVTLPHYPADGSTACKSGCRCMWSLVETDDEIRATWKLGGSESCVGCTGYAATYAPLVIAKTNDGRIARLYRAVA